MNALICHYKGFGIRRAGRGGFTLVELLVVIAIGATLAGLSLTAIGPLVTSNSLNQALSEVQGQLNLARQTAITLNREVEIRFYVESANSKKYPSDEITSIQVVVPPAALDTTTGNGSGAYDPPAETQTALNGNGPSLFVQKAVILPQNVVIASAQGTGNADFNLPPFNSLKYPTTPYPSLPANVKDYYFLTFSTTGSIIQSPATGNFFKIPIVTYNVYHAQQRVDTLKNAVVIFLNNVHGTYTIRDGQGNLR